MTEQRLKEIYRDVSHSAHEEMSTDNIHLMAMKQAVNEAIDETLNEVSRRIDGNGQITFSFKVMEDKLKVK